jgi:hypothetical protein
MLLKKTRLSGHVLGLQEIAQTYSDQAEFLFYAKTHTFAERQSDARQLFAGGRWTAGGVASRENLELAGLLPSHSEKWWISQPT